MPMNNRLLVPQKLPLLLDYAPGAAAAYSLRSLSNSYTGPVVTVRRSTDSAERDFTADEVSDGTLAAWCSGGDGFVKTWHDQSGEGNDASQSTAGYQPRIVDAGVLETEGGKAAVRFDGSDDALTVPSSTAAFKFLHDGTLCGLFAAARFGSSSNPDTHCALIGNNRATSASAGILIRYDDRSIYSRENRLDLLVTRDVSGTTVVESTANDTLAPNTQIILAILLNVSSAVASNRALPYENSVLVDIGNAKTAAPTTNNATEDLHIGETGGGAGFLDGTISELIIYPSDMTAQRQRIEGDMAWYY